MSEFYRVFLCCVPVGATERHVRVRDGAANGDRREGRVRDGVLAVLSGPQHDDRRRRARVQGANRRPHRDTEDRQTRRLQEVNALRLMHSPLHSIAH